MATESSSWGINWGRFWGGKKAEPTPKETLPESPGYGRPDVYIVERPDGDLSEFPPRGALS